MVQSSLVIYIMVKSDTPLPFTDPSVSQSASVIEFAKGLEAFAMMLVPVVDRVVAALLPFAQAVQEFVQRPDVQAKFAAGAEMMLQARDRIAAVEAPGYAPYFERLGHDPLSARLHVLLIRSCADWYYREHQDRRIALSALHDLAGRPRWHPSFAQQVERLRETCGSADFLDGAFRDAGCPELKVEFLDLLSRISGGVYAGGPGLIAIAKRISSYAPSPRGRQMAFDTVLHRVFLRASDHAGGRQGYTYGLVRNSDDAIEDYTDEATAATRIELKRPSFNPSSARRAERRRMAKEPADEGVIDRV